MMRAIIGALATALLLSACDSRREDSAVPAPTADEPAGPIAPVPTAPASVETPTPEAASSPPVAVTLPGTPGDRMAAIPEAMRGIWAGEGSSCAASSELRLEVSGDRLTFYESVARPVAMTRGDGQSVDAELELSGEGDIWRERQTFRLGDDGRSLTRRMANGKSVTYVRCNSNEAL